MASSAFEMDWEPEIPGSWPTTPRNTKKRTASDAGLKVMLANREDTAEEISYAARDSVPIRSMLNCFTTVKVAVKSVWNFFSGGASEINRHRQQRIAIVEMRRFTSDGFESVKRRAVNILRGPTLEQREVTQTRGTFDDHAPNITTNGKMREERHPEEMEEQRHPEDVRDQRNLESAVNLAHPPISTRGIHHKNRTSRDYREPYKSLEQEQNTSQLSITNQTLEDATTPYIQLREATSFSSDGRGEPAVEDELAAIVASLVPKPIPGLDIIVRKPLLLKADDYPRIQQKVRFQKIPSYSRQDSTSIYSNQPNQTPTMAVNSKTSRLSNAKVSSHVRVPNIEQHLTHQIAIQEKFQNFQQKPTQETPFPEKHKRKQVRIAIDPINGLPKRQIIKFFKGSFVGDWAPSSPWVLDQARRTASTLKGQLESLKDNISESPLPPCTPIAKNAIRYHSNTLEEIADNCSTKYKTQRQDSTLEGAITVSDPRWIVKPSVPINVDEANDTTIVIDGSPKLLLPDGRSPAHGFTVAEESQLEVEGPPTQNSDPRTGVDERLPEMEDNKDTFLELAMTEMGLSQRVLVKRQELRAAKEAARLKKKKEEEAAMAKVKAEEEEAARKAAFERRLPKRKLVQPLSRDWEEKIKRVEAHSGNVTLARTSNGTELKIHDLRSVLGGRNWLNDEIINGYIDWVVDYANKKAGIKGNATPKVVAQNSFFYDKLSKEGPTSVARWMKRKKAAGAKLLEVETVLIPVNNTSHWTLLVVSPKNRTIEYLDSFGGRGDIMIKNAKAWLNVELGYLWNESEWSVLDTASASQSNGYDCGVFVATNAECVVGGVSTLSYDGGDMAWQRRRIAAVLLNNGFSGEFVPAEEL